MTLVSAPTGTSLCGQACVAMAAGISLAEAVKAVGHEKAIGTETWEIVAALRKLGLKCADRCRRVSKRVPIYPPRALLVIRTKNKKLYHWMLYWDGVVWDPREQYPNYDGWEVTSYLEIFKDEPVECSGNGRKEKVDPGRN